MKVLYIIHSSRMDGSTISFLNMIEGLILKGIEVVIAGPSPSKMFRERLVELCVKYYDIKIVENVYPQNNHCLKSRILFPFRCVNLILRKRKFYHNLKEIAKLESPAIIHSNSGVISEGYSVAKSMNITHIWHLREYQDLGLNWSIFPSKDKFIRKLKKSNVISISEGISKHFDLENYNRCYLIYNGILSKNDISLTLPKKKYFLCCSRICEQKGHEDVIKSFSLFCKYDKRYRLVILGDGDNKYIDKLKTIAQDESCESQIDWLGYQKNVLPYMREATALIVASHYEGFGRMTAEACFSGCIVIGRSSGGTEEIINQTECGYLFNNNEELLQSMLDVTKMSADDYKRITKTAQERALKLYSKEANIENILNLYNKLIYNEES